MKYLGHGFYGTCYLTDDGKVFKDFNRIVEKPFIPKELINVKNDTYIFYDKVLYKDGNITSGYLKYIDSKTLDIKDIKMDDLISSIDKVYDDTKDISDKRICSYDVFPKNMMYDGKIRMIDTDLYSIDNEKDKDVILYQNIRNVNDGIGELLFSLDFNIQNINKNDELLGLFFQTFHSLDNKTLKEFLICLKKYLEDKKFSYVSEYRRFLEK